MKYESNYKFGQKIYLVNDADQVEYRLNRIFIGQKGVISLELLSPDGEIMVVLELHTITQKDILKSLEGGKDNEED